MGKINFLHLHAFRANTHSFAFEKDFMQISNKLSFKTRLNSLTKHSKAFDLCYHLILFPFNSLATKRKCLPRYWICFFLQLLIALQRNCFCLMSYLWFFPKECFKPVFLYILSERSISCLIPFCEIDSLVSLELISKSLGNIMFCSSHWQYFL